jgi:hypothetical protein
MITTTLLLRGVFDLYIEMGDQVKVSVVTG